MTRSLEGKHPKYYEAILQLRDSSKEVNDFVEKELSKLKLIVAKVAEVKGGRDYYLADNTLTKILGRKLEAHFGGKCVTTATLHTIKDSKEKYRTTVLFRQPTFKKGDKVEYQAEIYVVKSMTKDIFLQNSKTGKKVHLKFKEQKHVKSCL